MVNPWMLDFERTVPKKFVHKSAIAEVLIADSLMVSDGSFLAASQWPRQHHFYPLAEGRGLLGLLAETMRQGIFVICHQHLEVPLGRCFLMDRLVVTLQGSIPTSSIAATEVAVKFKLDQLVHSAGELRTLTFDAEFSAAGRVFGSGRGELRIVKSAIFDRLRAGRGQSSSALMSAGGEPESIAVPVSGDCWKVRIPFKHPVFFDHPLDHVPGMLIIEAIVQSVQSLHGNVTELTHFDGTFKKFIEFEPDIYISRTPKCPDSIDDLRADALAEEEFVVTQGVETVAVVRARISHTLASLGYRDRLELRV